MKTKLSIVVGLSAVGFSAWLGVRAQSGTVDKTNMKDSAWNFSTNFLVMPLFKRDTNKINLTISTIAIKPQPTNGFAIYEPMDYAVTNIQIFCSHEPIIIGKTNGEWCIRFK